MGKAALFIVIGLSVSLAFIKLALIGYPVQSMTNTSDYFSSVTATNIARSALNNYLKKLNQNKSLHGTFVEEDQYMEGGIDTVAISSASANPTIGDTISVAVKAWYNKKRKEASAKIVLSKLTIPPLEAAVAFPGQNPVLDLNGAPLIDGNNHDYTGNLSSDSSDLPGVAVHSTTDSVNIVQKLYHDKQEDHVVGFGGMPSVHVKAVDDPSVFIDPITASADYRLPAGTYSSVTFGSKNTPVIVYGQGDLKFSGGVVGHGILVIDGTLTLSGNFFWYGIVYVVGPSPEIFNSVGTNRIIGGVVLGGKDKTARLRGTADIQYSYEAVENVRNNTKSLLTMNLISWFE
ncbi:MAG: hypothetical protein GXO74_07290 [Calditrichaeota bacterium]|nr:hypothetical protein [Calditrichota bacterium]